jgi:hypothetical protein
MEISVNRTTRTIDIMVPRDQVSDELLGVLPEPTSQTEGCLAWSIRFGDVRRSSNSNETRDELTGISVGAIVGAISSQGRASSVEAEGKIRGTLILTFNNSPMTEALTPLGGRTIPISRPIPIFAENIATPSADSVSSSNIRPFPDTFGVVDNLTPVLLFANPFSG